MTDIAVPARRGTFFGEPRALAYLAFTEAWERFSYYGMTALLMLYMVQELLLPGRIEHVAGLSGFRSGLEWVLGPMTTLALATQVFGLYTGLVYFTPVLGGLVADRFLGRRNAVMLGAALMSAGHLAMAFDVSFLIALVLLIVGCGLLKGNISVQVGALYGEDDAQGRTRGFTIFSMAINIGATVGPLLCGLLAAVYGWHAGFGLAGVLMLVGLATYALGYRTLSESMPTASRTQPQARMDAAQWRVAIALIAVMMLTIFQTIAYSQNTAIGLVWISDNVDLRFFGFTIPVPWFNSIDSFVSILAVPPLVALWRWQGKRGGEPNEIAKISTGAFMAAIANLLLVLGCLAFTHVPVIMPVVYDILLGIAFLYYWPTLLALVSRAAPPAAKATMMGIAFMSLFLGNIIVGRLGAFYEQMPPAAFWGLHAGIAAVGGVLALLLNRPLSRLFATH